MFNWMKKIIALDLMKRNKDANYKDTKTKKSTFNATIKFNETDLKH